MIVSEPLLAVTRLKHLTGGAVSLLVCLAGVMHAPRPEPLALGALVGVLIGSWLWRSGLSELADHLARGVQLMVTLYLMVASVLTLALFFAPPDELRGSIMVLVACQIGLAALIGVGWVYPLTLLNSCLLIVHVSALTPGGAPLWVVGYMVVAALALITRYQELRLQGFPISRSVTTRLAVRQALLGLGVLMLLQMAILPLFPDVRAHLDLSLPAGGREPEIGDWVSLFFQFALLLGAVAVVIHLVRELFPRSKGEGAAAPPPEVEELFAEPIDRGQTRRVTRLRIFRDARERVVEEYCWLLRRLSRQGNHRPGFQTGQEFLQATERRRPAIIEPLAALTRLFYRARYSGEPIEREDVAEAQRLTREVLAKGSE